ncbi:immunity 22 family protein [Paenibacillus agricola]|uniref:Immunity 22 family protein n=1 Tax=Paenibacillus agricola TaxID=2716264 RepID=A0ABX0J322_9BACL|nr:immunity 22 family protein [Paenibacillus agricola]NHN30542.1 immunity 22 family protein [Paenibacillus agricola]
MVKEGFVSLWVGNISTPAVLEELMLVAYSEEGESIPSLFATYFGLPYYDDAVREAEYRESPSHEMEQLLAGFSYEEAITPRFIALTQQTWPHPFNTVILLYNFHYTGDIQQIALEPIKLQFLGAVPYQ